MTTISPTGHANAPALHNIAPPRGDTKATRQATRQAVHSLASQHPGVSNAVDTDADKHPKAAKVTAGFVINHPNTAKAIGNAVQNAMAGFKSHTA
jgi:hypothetical protein